MRGLKSVAIVRATVASTISTTAAVAATVTTVVATLGLLAGAVVFLLVDPALDADDAIQGAGFGEAVVERNTESLERHLAFAVAFGTGDVRATEAAGATE